MPLPEYARRMIRSRNWHLMQVGKTRSARYALVDEEIRHEDEAKRLEEEIRRLGYDPQAPHVPRPA